MSKHKLLLIFTFIITTVLHAQEDKKVAVFDPAGDVPNNIKTIIREELSNAVVNTLGFTVLERELINKVIAESQFQMSGHVDDGQIGELGKKMGANYVCYATISLVGKNYYISCKMVDVKTARIERQNTGMTSNGMNDLFSVVASVSRNMLQQSGSSSEFIPTTVQTTSYSKPKAKPVNSKPVPNNLPSISVYGMDILIMPNDITKEKLVWEEANNTCNTSTAYNYDDWRLPTKEEINVMYSNQAVVKNMNPYWYWSGSSDGEVFWRQAFDADKLVKADPRARSHVRCVRTHGLSAGASGMLREFNFWGKIHYAMPSDILKEATWQQASDGCSNLSAYGFDDWYLPSIEELDMLYTNRHNLGMNGAAYWSSSEKKKGAMFEKNFENGRTYDTGLSGERYVRCVRKE